MLVLGGGWYESALDQVPGMAAGGTQERLCGCEGVGGTAGPGVAAPRMGDLPKGTPGLAAGLRKPGAERGGPTKLPSWGPDGTATMRAVCVPLVGIGGVTWPATWPRQGTDGLAVLSCSALATEGGRDVGMLLGTRALAETRGSGMTRAVAETPAGCVPGMPHSLFVPAGDGCCAGGGPGGMVGSAATRLLCGALRGAAGNVLCEVERRAVPGGGTAAIVATGVGAGLGVSAAIGGRCGGGPGTGEGSPVTALPSRRPGAEDRCPDLHGLGT